MESKIKNKKLISSSQMSIVKGFASSLSSGQMSTRKGFSLVELLITTTIVIIMTGVLLINNNNKKTSSDVENAARVVAAQIRSLQNEALSGKRIEVPAGSGIYKNACSFKFDNYADSDQYCMGYYENCTATAPDLITNHFYFNSKKNVKVVYYDSIYFTAPSGKVNAPGSVILKSTNVAANACMEVKVSDTGGVTEQKIACP